MAIVNYGLFWQREEVVWHPGAGGTFRLLGRRGERRPGLRVANFREQKGVYILYGNYGVFYVGIVTSERLGDRLMYHHDNRDGDAWDRFSWFGFRTVIDHPDDSGVCPLGPESYQTVEGWIGDIESLLIRAVGPRDQRIENFTHEERWYQVPEVDAAYYLERSEKH